MALVVEPGSIGVLQSIPHKASHQEYSPISIQIRGLTVSLHWSAKFSTKLISLLRGSFCTPTLGPKTILQDVSADVDAGTLTAIIGGSGCGKTTLLSTMSQRFTADQVEVTGTVCYNSEPLSFDRHNNGREKVAYVLQDDVLIPELTVKETLSYAAELRLRRSTSREVREKRVSQLIEDLGLTQCANTRIGDSSYKGCSAGEKRRTSIGVQILENSSVLFLDEPTTGLDAASALQTIKILRSMAMKGRTIVMTIHQPRSDVWPLFDGLIVLSKGRTVYSGSAGECLPYLETHGYRISQHVNPFEYLIRIFAVDKRSRQAEEESQKRLDFLTLAWSQKALQSSDIATEKTAYSSTVACRQVEPSDEISTVRRIWILTRRTCKITCRDRLGAIASVLEAMVMGVVTGWIFYNVGSDLAGIRSREGAMWSAAGLQGYLILILETYRLTKEIKVFDREQKERVSSAITFVVSRRLARALLEDIPVPLIYSVILYFMAGFRQEAGQFLIFFAVIFLLHVTAVNLATLCAALHRNFLVSSLIANMFYTLQSMSCGFFINILNISRWLRWTKWIAYVYYAFGALCFNEFANHYYQCPASDGSPGLGVCQQYDGNFILESLDIPQNWLWRPMVALAGFALLFAMLAVATLHYVPNGVTVSRPPTTDDSYRGDTSVKDKLRSVAKRSITIQLEGITLTANTHLRFRRHSQQLVSNISTVFRPSVLNVIMGPSGSGKTTLLNFMARRAVRNIEHTAGRVRFNGAGMTDSVLRSVSAYVPHSDDNLLPHLTARETLLIAAKMRLPGHMSKQQRLERVESLISSLSLKDCANTLIGNELVRGISGGEKRRLSIAIQILANPLVLYLDEPTSGLDSVTATCIIDVLQRLTFDGCTVIMVLHQPQSDWLPKFGTMLILSKGGHAAYSGESSSMLAHFNRLGYSCPPYQNPADFVLDVVAADPLPAVRPGDDKWLKTGTDKVTDPRPDHNSTELVSQAAQLAAYARRPLRFGSALPLLLHRAYLNLRRQPVLALGRISQILGLGLILTFYFAPLKNDYYSVQSRMGCAQQVCSLLFVGMLNAIAIYPTERDLFFYEESDGLYSVEAFLCSYTLLEVPSEIIGSLAFGVLTVVAVGLPRTAELVFIMALNAFCVVSCGESIGIALMTFVSHTGLAVTLSCILMSISVHLTGVISVTMPGFLRGINYISPLRWMLGNVAPYSLHGVTFTCNVSQEVGSGRCPIETGEQVLQLYNLDVNPQKYLGVLVAVTIGYRVLSYVILKLRYVRHILKAGCY